jgi:hypothetical protein
MFKKSLVALTLLTLPLTAFADWSAGAGYANISDTEDGVDLSLGAIFGSVAYEFSQENSPFSFVSELRLGTGVSDDEASLRLGEGEFAIPESINFKVEVDRFTTLSVRAQYNYDNGVYLYVMPSYANLDVTVSSMAGSYSDGSWEFGFGGGVGKKISDKTSIEASYESYDGTDFITVGFKYAF